MELVHGHVEPARALWHRPRLTAAVGPHFDRYGIVGRSAALGEVIERIDLVAATRSTVLITGETGTGKELVARAIHARSGAAGTPFIKVNCAAIPEALLESELFGHVRGAFTGATTARKGKFALAHGGTILLDEIATMGTGVQAKLLRVLQEREFEPLGAERVERVDVRVVAATNRDLRQLVTAGRFLEDLYYRLHVVPIVVPPLRRRLEDVGLLAEYFAAKHADRNGWDAPSIEPEVVETLRQHDWPGNVRELENTIERAVVMTARGTIRQSAISIDAPAAPTADGVPSFRIHENVQWIERETIRRALRSCRKKSEAAALMGISARALSHYLAKYPSLDAESGAASSGAAMRAPQH
jgi:transcriptional regulator with GAF, ATPase, and Fis domain